jgi:putative sigma-54 modulation protein
MKINVQSIHFDADVQLLAFIEKKGSKLAQFFDQIIDAEAILRLEKSSEDQKNKLVEFKVNIPGHLLFAKDHAKSFEEAVDICVESLRKQILKHKEKITV